MRCPTCTSEFPLEQKFCPYCGTVVVRQSFGGRRPGLLIAMCMSIVLAGFGAYAFTKGGYFAQLKTYVDRQRPPRRQPVERGEVAKPEELQRHGKLYFVP